MREIDGKEHRCEHLIVLLPIGQPNATKCAIHDFRYSGMPIRLKAEDGSSIDERCIPEYPLRGEKLLPTCSYRP